MNIGVNVASALLSLLWVVVPATAAPRGKADGPRRPAELRAALGIASANFFTARYLTPLAKAGYISAGPREGQTPVNVRSEYVVATKRNCV